MRRDELRELTAYNAQDDVYIRGKWNRMLWRDEVIEKENLQELLRYGQGRNKEFPVFAAEVFSRLYDYTEKKTETAEQSMWWQYHQTLEQSPDWKTLRQQTVGSSFWASVGTFTLARNIVEQIPEMKESPREEQRKLQELEELLKDNPNNPQLQNAVNQQREKVQKLQEQYQQAIENFSGTARHALRKALEKAKKELQERQQEVAGLLPGSDKGQLQQQSDIKTIQQIYSAIEQSSKLRRIAELAGRFKALAARAQAEKMEYERAEISEVKIGNDIAHLLPQELALLDDEDYEDYFLAQLVEGKLQQYDLQTKQPKAKGPVVVCIDESGSMDGIPDIWAKAVALGLLQIAIQQNRTFAIVHFSSEVERVYIQSRRDRATKTKQQLVAELLNELKYFSGGGTNFEAALRTSLELIKNEKDFTKADVVFITDGYDTVGGEFRDKFIDECNRLKVRRFAFLINTADEYGTLETLGFEIQSVHDFGANKEVESVYGKI